MPPEQREKLHAGRAKYHAERRAAKLAEPDAATNGAEVGASRCELLRTIELKAAQFGREQLIEWLVKRGLGTAAMRMVNDASPAEIGAGIERIRELKLG